MRKILSIIIPTFNMEALLDKCLTSLILDDYENREMLDVIVVIDGATDRSSEIAHKYADEYPETFSVIDKENGNYGSCINAALPAVKGKYVRILDADDSYETKNLKGYLDMLSAVDVDLVLNDYATYDPDDKLVSESSFSFIANKIFKFCDIPYDTFLAMHAVSYRSGIFKEIDYHQTEGVSYTDMEWVFHPMSRVNRVYYYNKQIYRYLVGREGQTVDDNVRLKRLSHVEKGLFSQLKAFNTIETSVPAYKYLHNIVINRTKHIYLSGLNRHIKFDFSTFDNHLKSISLDIYKQAGDITLPLGLCDKSIYIVKIWRKVKHRELVYFHPLYLLYKFMLRFNR